MHQSAYYSLVSLCEDFEKKMRYNGTVLYYVAITKTFGICYEAVAHKLTRLYAVHLFIHIYSRVFANQNEMDLIPWICYERNFSEFYLTIYETN